MRKLQFVLALTAVVVASGASAQTFTPSQCRQLADATQQAIGPTQKLFATTIVGAVAMASALDRLDPDAQASAKQVLKAQDALVAALRDYVGALSGFRQQMERCGQ
jgi:NAD(P)H-dependent FMN reductase